MRRVVIAGTLMTAAAVAVGGIIAFVGFVVPHISRRLVGPKHRFLLPASMIFGAMLLVLADWISRIFLQGIEVGIVTSLLGAPVFCAILRRRLTQP
jgi:iron complex transport system permease protein